MEKRFLGLGVLGMLTGLQPGTYIARVWEAVRCEDTPCGVTKFTIPEKKGSFITINLRSEFGGWSAVKEESVFGKKGILESRNVSPNPTRTPVQIQYNLPVAVQVRTLPLIVVR